MSQYKLKVIDIVQQPDGSALVTFDIHKETREFIKNLYGWKKWNSKKFQQILLEAIDNYVKTVEKREGTNDGNF
jgi:hypothetical protein